MRQLLILLVATSASSAQETAPSRVEVQKVANVLAVFSLGRPPRAQASHTFILAHGLRGVDERFFTLGHAILTQEPDANVLVVDWSPGANRQIGGLPNPLAAAERIDLTGDLLGSCLTKLSKKKCFDSAQATFIGESFGNCVNHRAALALRKNGLRKAGNALVLNPAPSCAGYETPLFTVAFQHSVACVSDSWFDTRQAIANKLVFLKPAAKGPVEQHTHGMRWLQERIDAGENIGSLFTKARTGP